MILQLKIFSIGDTEDILEPPKIFSFQLLVLYIFVIKFQIEIRVSISPKFLRKDLN